MINTYSKIDQLFGAPLNTVATPHAPFKLKTWHVVAGVVVIGLTAYGAYSIYKDVYKKPDFKFKEPGDPKSNQKTNSKKNQEGDRSNSKDERSNGSAKVSLDDYINDSENSN